MQWSSQMPGLALGIQFFRDLQRVRIGLDYGMKQRIKGRDPIEVIRR
jgi:hypothetical protein